MTPATQQIVCKSKKKIVKKILLSAGQGVQLASWESFPGHFLASDSSLVQAFKHFLKT